MESLIKKSFNTIAVSSSLFREDLITTAKGLGYSEARLSDTPFHGLRLLIARKILKKDEVMSTEFKTLWATNILESSRKGLAAHHYLAEDHFVILCLEDSIEFYEKCLKNIEEYNFSEISLY